MDEFDLEPMDLNAMADDGLEVHVNLDSAGPQTRIMSSTAAPGADGAGTTALDFDEAAFVVSLQQLETDMNASVAQHRVAHEGGTDTGACCGSCVRRCTPRDEGRCAAVVAGVSQVLILLTSVVTASAAHMAVCGHVLAFSCANATLHAGVVWVGS